MAARTQALWALVVFLWLAPTHSALAQGAPARLRADLVALTASEMMGRGADTEGWKVARDYISGRMKKLGLEPAGAQGYLSPVEVIWGVEVGRGTRLKFGDMVLAKGVEYTPMSVTGVAGFDAPMVFVGHGWQEPAWDDYAGADVRGKVVLMLTTPPPGLAPTPWRRAHGSAASRAARAMSMGAKAVLMIGAPRAALPRLRPAPGLSEFPVLMVRWEVAVRAWPGLEKAAKVTTPGSRSLSWRARGQVDVVRHKRVMHNVVGRLPGSPKTGPPLILGAHYDGLGLGWLEGKEALHPGADDNASGVAMMLEVARQMARAGVERARPVWFVAFTGEELGMRGSRAMAGELLRSGHAKGALLVNADMVGKLGAVPLQVLGSSSRWGGVAEGATRSSGLEISWGRWDVANSDHVSFVERGMDALHLTTGVHVYYHSPRDVLSVVDVSGLVRVSRWVEKLLAGVAGRRRKER